MLKPLNKKIVVTENVKSKTTSSGIIVTGRHGDTQTANVVAIGPEVKHVATGDTVLVDWSKGTIVPDNGVQYIVFDEANVLAVLED